MSLQRTETISSWTNAAFPVAGAIHWLGDSMPFFWKDLAHGVWHVLAALGFYLYFELAYLV